MQRLEELSVVRSRPEEEGSQVWLLSQSPCSSKPCHVTRLRRLEAVHAPLHLYHQLYQGTATCSGMAERIGTKGLIIISGHQVWVKNLQWTKKHLKSTKLLLQTKMNHIEIKILFFYERWTFALCSFCVLLESIDLFLLLRSYSYTCNFEQLLGTFFPGHHWIK